MQSRIVHDYSHRFRSGQTIKDRKRIHAVSRPFGEIEHLRRTLRAEFIGGCVLGIISGVFVSTVIAAFTAHWWAPAIASMVFS